MAVAEEYSEFLARKSVAAPLAGFDVTTDVIHPMLFDWQREIVSWALRLGKAAIFAECGLGKTFMQVEWARHVAAYTGGKVLIAAPLAVAHQTISEGARIGVSIAYCRSQETADVAAERVLITNYDMLKEFDASHFEGIVLDESSILKAFTGAIKRMILSMFEKTRFKLACTATPAPNDHLELGNHAEFLNIMRSNEMISRWFINDTMKAGNYRLKKHAEDDFWRWVTSWAVCMSTPSDLGYSDDGFLLPELRMHSEIVEADHTRAYESGQLFLLGAPSATAMWAEKRATAADRCRRAKDIIGDSIEPWIIWCDTNDEADTLAQLFPDAVEVRGSDSIKAKEERLTAFSEGRASKIITKSDIAGFGLNWQHCHNQVFVGVTYSFEKTYQALRRSWRYGQTRPVDAYLIYAESEGGIAKTLEDKRVAHLEMQAAMNRAMAENGLGRDADRRALVESAKGEVYLGDSWRLDIGDAVEVVSDMPDNSVDYWIFSPPFSNLYIYSDSIADMGNCANHEEFFDHFGYLIAELYRTTVPGRLCSVHCKDLPLYMNRDDAAGLYDFPGDIVHHFKAYGWVFHSRVTIWKDPVIEMQRTKNHGLLYKNFRLRGEVCRQGMADYVLTFRKWLPERDTTQEKPVLHDRADYPLEVWQRYASPVWDDINQTRVLNYQIARESKDEKHICPLQLDVIERCIQIWSNPGDLVGSPFAGIGSEGYEAIRLHRRFTGVELKQSYAVVAARNLDRAELEAGMPTLFDGEVLS
jgi:DNA modification methylase/superfamily II DNA or RNA helicase